MKAAVLLAAAFAALVILAAAGVSAWAHVTLWRWRMQRDQRKGWW